jgi:uncharacterized protein YgiM (DUF1202 family)
MKKWTGDAGSPKSRKTFWGIVCALCILAGVLGAFPRTAGAISSFEEATVIASDVNIRLRPTVDSPFVLKLKEGTRIGVFCEETDGWYRIIYGTYRGYVSSEYVFLPTSDMMVGNILVDECPLTRTPSYGDPIATANAGDGVTITDIQGGFYYISLEDGTGGFTQQSNVKVSSAKQPTNLLKMGMEGAAVTKMQSELRKRGFLPASSTGFYGDITKAAVETFQDAAGLSPDGIAGAKTLEMLYSDNDIIQTAAARAGITGGVRLTPWSDAKYIFDVGTVCTVTDARTGISWEEKRFGGWLHADSEPLTADDAAKMKKAFGGSWSWDRRAVWVTVGGVTMAASINGMPHMSSTIGGNNFPGHHCIHFLNSKVHETNAECPRHQAMVQYAYKLGNSV